MKIKINSFFKNNNNNNINIKINKFNKEKIDDIEKKFSNFLKMDNNIFNSKENNTEKIKEIYANCILYNKILN
jgi:hypothetical protein